MFRLVAPDMDKGWMVAFDAATDDEAWSGNAAIRHTFDRFQPFHQVGTRPDGANLAGYHAWELWQSSTEQERAECLEAAERWYREVQS